MIGDNDIGRFQSAQSLDFIAENIIDVASALQSKWNTSVYICQLMPRYPSEPGGPIYRWNPNYNESAEKINELLKDKL